MERVICLAVGYLFGMFQTAYFYGKAHGIDIRQHGSGNAGTTNTLRVLGTKAGLIVFAGDCLKCMVAVWLMRLVFGNTCHDMIYLLCLYTGAGAILGHNYPFYLRFKGGKGIAATAGMVLSFHPYFIVTGLLLFFIPFFTLHYVSLGSLLVYAGLMIQLVIVGENGWLFTEMSRGQLIEMYIVFGCLLIMAYWKHRENIKRLLHGEERKTYLGRKNKAEIEQAGEKAEGSEK